MADKKYHYNIIIGYENLKELIHVGNIPYGKDGREEASKTYDSLRVAKGFYKTLIHNTFRKNKDGKYTVAVNVIKSTKSDLKARYN